MKPKNLKFPCTWEERKVVIQDSVWFIPEYYDAFESFTFPGWEEIFENKNPVMVEYCSGNGAWIIARAQAFPHLNWIAIEMKFERVRKIWSKMKNLGLSNLVIVCGEGHTATSQYFPKETISEIFINFPDPWPKRAHAKHRIIKAPFVAEMARILVPGGKATLVTDDPDYSAIMMEAMGGNANFQSTLYTTENPSYGTSYFDQLWRSKGKQIRYHQYARN